MKLSPYLVSNSNRVNFNKAKSILLRLIRKVSNSNRVNFNPSEPVEPRTKTAVSNSNGVNFNKNKGVIRVAVLGFKLQRSKF